MQDTCNVRLDQSGPQMMISAKGQQIFLFITENMFYLFILLGHNALRDEGFEK